MTALQDFSLSEAKFVRWIWAEAQQQGKPDSATLPVFRHFDDPTWDSDDHPRAGAGLGAKLKRAADRFHALAHADQTKPFLPCGIDIEPFTVVSDRERQVSCRPL